MVLADIVKPTKPERKNKMRKTLLWLLLLTLAVLYSLVIYSWWVEGNTNRYKQEIEASSESI